MNSEVNRLRRLRQTALKVRALATVLRGGHRYDAVLERGALLTWRVARIATGRLRSHPYENYHRDPSFFESGADRLNAMVLGTVAGIRGQGMRTFLQELRCAARELDDARALTLSPDLSEAFGRAQGSMRQLLTDCESEALCEAGSASGAGGSAASVASITGVAAIAGSGAVTRVGAPGLAAPRLSMSSYLAL